MTWEGKMHLFKSFSGDFFTSYKNQGFKEFINKQIIKANKGKC